MAETLPAWLSAKVDQRLALIDQHAAPAALAHQFPLILTPLAEPDEHATAADRAKWERTCDCCSKHCPWPVKFYTGHVQRELPSGVLVVMTYGVCEEHAHG